MQIELWNKTKLGCYDAVWYAIVLWSWTSEIFPVREVAQPPAVYENPYFPKICLPPALCPRTMRAIMSNLFILYTKLSDVLVVYHSYGSWPYQ
jgi:hypothetical protein